MASNLPGRIWLLVGIYFLASLAHFAHNAEYIAFYPNMPSGLTREQVYLVWWGITGIGVAGLALSRFSKSVAGLVCLGAYGAIGLGGLGHYALALCSEHTFAMNTTIWSEAVAGLGLAICCGALVFERLAVTVRASARRRC